MEQSVLKNTFGRLLRDRVTTSPLTVSDSGGTRWGVIPASVLPTLLFSEELPPPFEFLSSFFVGFQPLFVSSLPPNLPLSFTAERLKKQTHCSSAITEARKRVKKIKREKAAQHTARKSSLAHPHWTQANTHAKNNA